MQLHVKVFRTLCPREGLEEDLNFDRPCPGRATEKFIISVLLVNMHVAGPAAPALKRRAAFMMIMDGDYSQVQSAQKFVDQCRASNVDMFKLCASCSLSPADLGSLHRFLNADARRHNDGTPSPEMDTFLTTVFDKTNIPAASRRRCLTHVESAVSASFSRSNMLLGWKRSGLTL